MKTSRRTLLLGGITALFAPWLERAQALSLSTTSQSDPLANLPLYLETLLPAEPSLPGAINTGVPTNLLEKAFDDPAYERLLQAGGRWLEREARRNHQSTFNTLGEEQRIRLVEKAEQSKSGSLPRVFFLRTREDAFAFYYSQPQVWAALGYSGPPQPVGYPNFHSPPRPGDRTG